MIFFVFFNYYFYYYYPDYSVFMNAEMQFMKFTVIDRNMKCIGRVKINIMNDRHMFDVHHVELTPIHIVYCQNTNSNYDIGLTKNVSASRVL